MAGPDDVDRQTRKIGSGADADTVVENTNRRLRSAPPLPEYLATGVTLGRYVIEELVGEGGMGIVYAAHDPELRRRVAIKLLRPELGTSNNSAGRSRLLREA